VVSWKQVLLAQLLCSKALLAWAAAPVKAKAAAVRKRETLFMAKLLAEKVGMTQFWLLQPSANLL
jgi:hypothetical protein